MIGRVADAFQRNFEDQREIGASVSVWENGREVLTLCDGFRDRARTLPWESDTLVLLWSATKGVAAACLLHALDRAGLDLQTPVVEIWPAFGSGGKDRVTLAEVLSHRAGVSALGNASLSVHDHEAIVQAIGEQEPFWEPGDGHGYSPRVFGFVLDELVRGVAGRPLAQYWREEMAEPFDLDIWIGLPEKEHGRAAEIVPPRLERLEDQPGFDAAIADPTSLTSLAFRRPAGAGAISVMNQPEWRRAALPAFSGMGSARSLAKFYSLMATGAFGPRILQWATTRLANGPDRVLHVPTAFSAGFMQNPLDDAGRVITPRLGPSSRAFGHPGAGGSLAFADPDRGIGFAYTMNQMGMGVLPGPRAQRLVAAVYDLITYR